MKELISYFAANIEVLLSIGDIAVIILCAATFYKVSRLNSRMEVYQKELKADTAELNADTAELLADQAEMIGDIKISNTSTTDLENNQAAIQEGLEVVKTNTGKLKTKRAVTKSKLKKLKASYKKLAKDLKELQELQTSQSIEFNNRITAIELNLVKQATRIKPRPAQVFELSSEELKEFRAENCRSFQNMQDLLWCIRYDIGVIREIYGIRNSESADE